jgi:lysophospholipase L1-like esterase
VITNPAARTILCFGDSNTYGDPSDDPENVRLAADVRWTGRLQLLLADGYYVIEEGLGGRTTDLDDDARPGRNGRSYLVPCLLSHDPVDVVVLMLGTNDLKVRFDRSPAEIAGALGGLVDDVESYASGPPKVILVSPIRIDITQRWYAEMNDGEFDDNSVRKSAQLSAELRRIAGARGVLFADAASVAHARSGRHPPQR